MDPDTKTKKQRLAPSDSHIRLRGARQNNLKNLDLDFPVGRLIAVTGVSGSGKSSLAFDTLYAEGQRRYIESFSTYARQFLDRMDKPEVERVESIPPAIAIDQSNPVKNSRSTVGTMTELTDYVKLLFAQMGELSCEGCGEPIRRDSPASIWEHAASLIGSDQGHVALSFPLEWSDAVTEEEVRVLLGRLGLRRVFHEQRVLDIDDIGSFWKAGTPDSKEKTPPLNVLVDRFLGHSVKRSRVIDSLDTALRFGKGRVDLWFDRSSGLSRHRFSDGRQCANCGIDYANPIGNLFSFNSPLGACEHCKGFGRTIGIDLDLVVPNQKLSLGEGAVKPWTSKSYREGQTDLLAFARKNKIPADRPWRKLSNRHRRLIVEGDDTFYGIQGFFDWLETKTYKMHIRVLLSKYRSYRTCEACGGSRLKSEALLYRLDGRNIAEVYASDIKELRDFFENFRAGAQNPVAELLVAQITSRLTYLNRVGLGYLTLDRQSRTLSGGEVQRVDLTTALGSSLINTLYVLDEPSIGLHPRDTARLMEILTQLKHQHNTVVVVEHDVDVIRQVDEVFDIGPGAGEHGGEVIFQGSPRALAKREDSLTGSYLAGRKTIPRSRMARALVPGRALQIRGANQNNLKNLDIDIPIGVMTVISGVSGSGKSSLMHDVLYRSFLRHRGRPVTQPGEVTRVHGLDNIQDMVLVDQSPVGRTPRANALTYMKAYDDIRRLFAQTDGARRAGFTSSSFSFNVDGGRCPLCSGEGFEKIEMQFLSDVYVTCESCDGARFTREILDVRLRGMNIRDVLELSVNEATRTFADVRKLIPPLTVLADVGLGYLRLGQPVNTLSGGEAQRLKLAAHMNRAETERVVFLFDEPTTGLHFEDVKTLLTAFDKLVESGATLVVIEHHLDVIKNADHVVDLGPEGGAAGGFLLGEGRPETIARIDSSATGQYLGRVLGGVPASLASSPKTASRRRKPAIEIRGARQNNLQNVDIDIPQGELVVITGLSGSGKSSLAFDILFAEGQRRFIESLSPYARQYIRILDRPEVDSVQFVPPTIAIEQRLTQGNQRSTVATATEIYHYLRLLYSKMGTQHCVDCDEPINPQTEDQILLDIERRGAKASIRILAPLIRAQKGTHREIIDKTHRSGFGTFRIDGEDYAYEDVPELARYVEHDIQVEVASLRTKRSRTQLADAVRTALRLGHGSLVTVCRRTRRYYDLKRACPRCRRSYEEPDPRMFSFNSRYGACEACHGVGIEEVFDVDKLVPDQTRPVSEAVALFRETKSLRSLATVRARFARLVRQCVGDKSIEFRHLSKKQQRDLMGTGGADGLLSILDETFRHAGDELKSALQGFRSRRHCQDCGGARLGPTARAVKIEGLAIHELVVQTPQRVQRFLTDLASSRFGGRTKAQKVARGIFSEIGARLNLLMKVGLSYLQLSRSADTLSGGEAQRIRLASQLGSQLRGVCYILDEPTIGLHSRDNGLLLGALKELKQAGNSVVVVEHDDQTIREADRVIDLGPEGGTRGGRVVAQGTPLQLQANRDSVTGSYLKRRVGRRHPPRNLDGERLEIVSATAHNLKNISVDFPLGRLSVVSGVSGSGKSTLVHDLLFAGLRSRIRGLRLPRGMGSLRGDSQVERAVEVDQSPIGKTPRSIPASYVGFWNELRQLFAMTPMAKMAGYSPSRFSFNVKGGRCEHCSGQGQVKMEMSFLPNVYVRCDYCDGKRYNEQTLGIRYRGNSIADILEMTHEEAETLFSAVPSVHRPLKLLNAIGLGYLKLGQPSNTLSGGEAQRIKIAFELAKPSRKHTVYVLDEPTTGLHMADVDRLITVLHSLVEASHTVVVIEHNLDVIANADYVIDLGPEGGDAGGQIVFAGSPDDLSRYPRSYTAQALGNASRREVTGGSRRHIARSKKK